MDRPKRLKLGDLVIIHWRDSFEPQVHEVAKLEEDCTWFSLGFVVKMTDLFIYLAASIQETKLDSEQIDQDIAVPWTQILELEVIK